MHRNNIICNRNSFFSKTFHKFKKPDQDIFITDYRRNDFSQDNYDHNKDFFGPHLHDKSIWLAERLIGKNAVQHYKNIDKYTLFPFTMFHFQRNYRSAIVNTNNLGFRAQQLDSYLKDARPKIIVLGGSAIFGTFVTADDKTVSSQLERFLRSHGHDVVCINLAMGGFTSEQEMITLARIGMRFNPSLVIALDGANDVVHNVKHRDLPHYFPRLANLFYGGMPPYASPGNYVRGLIISLARYSAFFRLSASVAEVLSQDETKTRFAPKIDNAILLPHLSDHEAMLDNYLNAHKIMASICQARNIPYIAGLQPVCGLWIEPRWEGEMDQSMADQEPFASLIRTFDRELAELAGREGFFYLNCGKILAESDNIYNFSDRVHLTDLSAAVIAHRLGQEILQRFPQTLTVK